MGWLDHVAVLFLVYLLLSTHWVFIVIHGLLIVMVCLLVEHRF